MRVFAEVAELLGDGDNTEANEGTFENVLVQTGPDLTECEPGQVIVDVKAACINYPDLLQTVVRSRAGSRQPTKSGADNSSSASFSGIFLHPTNCGPIRFPK